MPLKIQLNRKVFKKIDEILLKFDGVNNFTLIESDSDGIGTTLDMEFNHTMLNESIKIMIPIVDVSDW